LNALITDAVTALQAAIAGPASRRARHDGRRRIHRSRRAALAPLVTASLENVLSQGRSALTGPVSAVTSTQSPDTSMNCPTSTRASLTVTDVLAVELQPSVLQTLREMLEAHP
jgi:hypothetical protein